MKLYLFDMGSKIYGDCILAVHEDGTTILIDGAHPGDWQASGDTPSIPDQIKKVLGKPPFEVDLLVVTHCHSDHIGCLPKMVEDGTITFKRALVADEKLGFPSDEEDAGIDAETAKVVAAIVEEPQPDLDGPALDQFLTDAVRLPENYANMLSKLATDGTKIVRYTGPNRATKQIEREFAKFDLKILGPTKDHLEACSAALLSLKQKARRASDGLRRADADTDAASIYKRLISGPPKGADAALDDLSEYLDRVGPGAALNDQSIVLSLGAEDERSLLTGDMQLAVPEVARLDESMNALLAAIKDAGPYRFVKLPHHASYNGFDEDVLEAFKDAEAFGISTGRGDPNHPDSGVLKLLKKIADTYHWARTDRNGRIAVSFSGSKVKIGVEDGELDDASPNSKDVMPEQETEGEVAEPSGPAVTPPPSPPVLSAATQPAKRPPASVVRRVASGEVEVTAKIPHTKTRVTITIDIEPGEAEVAPLQPSGAPKAAPSGRDDLPPLLFVTHAERLSENIGRSEAAGVLASLEGRYGVVDLAKEPSAFEAIRREARNAPVKGVVIVGGYDVVPSERYDTLPPSLRASIGPSAQNDPDNFIVWSDQSYGDLDGDLLADVPVSRIPDGHTARVVQVALTGKSPSSKAGRFGLRNYARPFADQIYSGVTGIEGMLTSQAVRPNAINSGSLSAKLIYLMLHGSDTDGSRFWGETQGGMLEALNVTNVPDPCGGIIFSGCCWGALTVRTRAAVYRSGDPVQVVTPAQSVALSFLSAGASAFVGCTGAHYSPVDGNHLNYFGAPLHTAFWKQIVAGKKPAEALFLAKIDYIRGMPHGRDKIEEVAIENKILRQFTCLGLGW
jgi:beta-lactamase superfamily II metal-dependent hydrolase